MRHQKKPDLENQTAKLLLVVAILGIIEKLLDLLIKLIKWGKGESPSFIKYDYITLCVLVCII